ncbi:hypothetical protein Dimus_006656 [Dionaea muscipula]
MTMMLGGIGGLLPPPPSSALLQLKRPQHNSSFFVTPAFPKQIYQMHQPTLFPELYPVLNSRSLGRRSGFLVFAKKRFSGGGHTNTSLVEEEDSDEDEDFDFDFDFVEEDDVEGFDEHDEDVTLPLVKKNAWLRKKPRGFGEGKEYDTSIEEKLLQEIEQSRKAQLRNVNQLKLNPIKPKLKITHNAPEILPRGIRVCVKNLPKKKNIHRDLKSAFKGAPGIIDISPIVSGNKKTKDPICKGLAYVDFKSLDDANRFIRTFSGQTVTFGKIEKKIKYELLNSSDSGYKESSTDERKQISSQATFAETVVVMEGGSNINTNKIDSSLSLSEYGYPEISREIINGGLTEDSKSSTLLDHDDGAESTTKSSPDLLPPSKTAKPAKEIEKNVKSRKKTDKVPALSIPGAAKRLKVREKAMLAGVFSKYRRNVDSASER